MTRSKKERRLGKFMPVLEQKPKKQERLADPNSKESRRKKAQQQEKKKESVYARTQATKTRATRDEEAGRRGTRHGGPLAEKIRRLNEQREAQEQARKSEGESESVSEKESEES
ncbi:hypothetical protein [Marinobacterium lutimaris]|uniref:Uncharacterized protein n=1 Tax=Marinobacterium lutimaris TaxID=568106 RepID=A0A1H5UTS1_9GAMM|nr:hypothetical protein [Marinobacterium lutimaris]SEF78396.1 hypothetical protein SAMN05444390_101503 [Marinobacterium lutimaris]